MQRKRVAIVGAGPSGLAAIKNALDYGFEPTCFEKNNELGGLWLYKPNETEEMSAFSTFPPPADAPNFMHNTELIKYFRSYADHYDLGKYIKYNHQIVFIERAPSYNSTGQWIVHYETGNEGRQEQLFDGVLLAVGHHKTPHFPDPWPGQDDFQGRIIHSHSYKDHVGYEDKVCVVVGIGNSGVDVATELSHVAKQVYLSTRRGTWLVNRVGPRGLPFDIVWRNRFQTIFPPITWFGKSLEDRLNERFDHELFGLKPCHKMTGAHPTVNDELPNRLASGTCLIRPDIARFTKTGVVFIDGRSVENVDDVVFCTGYDITFPDIENGQLVKVDKNQIQMYKYMYPLTTADQNTLCVLGMIQPLGAIFPIAEMQARVFYEALAGHIRLPPVAKMIAECKERKEKLAKRYVCSQRHTIQVDYQPFMDELADMIGAKPAVFWYLLTDLPLAKFLLFGPNVAYVYRLNGPHKWKDARNAIMTVMERVRAPTLARMPFSPPTKKTSRMILLRLSLVGVVVTVATTYAVLRYRPEVQDRIEAIVHRFYH